MNTSTLRNDTAPRPADSLFITQFWVWGSRQSRETQKRPQRKPRTPRVGRRGVSAQAACWPGSVLCSYLRVTQGPGCQVPLTRGLGPLWEEEALDGKGLGDLTWEWVPEQIYIKGGGRGKRPGRPRPLGNSLLQETEDRRQR